MAATVARNTTAPAGHPVLSLALRRAGQGVVTVFIVSVMVFLATEVLPGNAAFAVLGQNANPVRVRALEQQLHLNRGLFDQYWTWFSGLFRASSAIRSPTASRWETWSSRGWSTRPCSYPGGRDRLGPRRGPWRPRRAAQGRLVRPLASVMPLAITALPEFVIAIALIILFATVVTHILPAVSLLAPGTYAYQQPKLLVLPVATLVIVIIPYIMRMMRAAMIEALESDYVEMARLEGLPELADRAPARAAERDRAHHPGHRAELPVPGRRDRHRRVRLQLPRHRGCAW